MRKKKFFTYVLLCLLFSAQVVSAERLGNSGAYGDSSTPGLYGDSNTSGAGNATGGRSDSKRYASPSAAGGAPIYTSPRDNVYRIGASDKINVEVWGNKDLSSVMTVRPDGRISLPLLGEIYAVGMSPNELKKELTKRFAEFINNPEVTIKVLQVNSMKINVFGNVGFAGPHSLKGPTTLLQFFAVHKIPKKVDLDKSFIVREGQKIKVDLYELIVNGAIDQNILLASGDLIYFMDVQSKKKTIVSRGGYIEKIRVIGAVKREVVLTYTKGLTVLDALMRAGGVNESADKSKVKLVRRREGNKVDEVILNMNQIVDPNEKTLNNVLLRPGDILIVPTSWFAF